MLFELMSKLKANFQKSSLTRINVSQEWVIEAAMILNCKICSISQHYDWGKSK